MNPLQSSNRVNQESSEGSQGPFKEEADERNNFAKLPTGGVEGKSLEFPLTDRTPALLQTPDLRAELPRIHQPLLCLGPCSPQLCLQLNPSQSTEGE